ncbi:radical SAM protein [Desulforhabdus sp. TSK]|uniref:radical SAM protein n=1 Tax=Desulforhabdus sp. TSK TaxID=2925014 RepID=UPI001FC83865|nr:radical SAM protein [Desulforhabdus sp. TSK]GKT10737.1 hypothetical protein DSTSK_40420 [Desulforhabdus sp. TSK]
MKKSYTLPLGVLEGILRRDRPSYLVFFVTSRCNCHCSMCFNRENVECNHPPAELSLAEVETVARSLKPLPQLLLSGGEPFLRRDVASLVTAFYRFSATRQVSIPTNGTLPGPIFRAVQDILDQCPDAYLNINLSLDGVADYHDASRGFPGCFERVCETYQLLDGLRQKNKRLTLNFLTVVKKQNAAHMSSFIRYVREHFRPNYHSIGFVRGNIDEDEKDFDRDALRAELDALYPEPYAVRDLPVFSRIGLAIAAVFKETLRACERNNTRRRFHCLAGRKMVVLTSDGKLMPCEPLWLEPEVRKGRAEEDFMLGDLREFHFDAGLALRSPQALRVKEFIQRRECWCAYGCAVYNSILYSPCNYPRILRKILF